MSLRTHNLRPAMAVARPGQMIIPNRGPGWRPSLTGVTINVGTDGAGTFGFLEGQFGSITGQLPAGVPPLIECTVQDLEAVISSNHLQTFMRVAFEGGVLPGVGTFLINDDTMDDYRVLYLRPEPNFLFTEHYEGYGEDDTRGVNWAAQLGNDIALTTRDAVDDLWFLQSRYEFTKLNQARTTFFDPQSTSTLAINPPGGPGGGSQGSMPILLQSENAGIPSDSREWFYASQDTDSFLDIMVSVISGVAPDLGTGFTGFDVWDELVSPQSWLVTIDNPYLGTSVTEISLRDHNTLELVADRRRLILERTP